MLEALDGPGVYGTLSVSTATELKVGGSALEERKVVSFQPVDGDIYYGYDSSVSTSTGTLVLKNQLVIIEAGTTLPVWLIAATGTVDVRITEVA